MRVRLVGCLLFLRAVAGCQPTGTGAGTAITRTYDTPIPELPPAGMVRIVPQKVTEHGKTVQWKWIVVGERNWQRLLLSNRVDDRVAELAEPYPLDDLAVSGGTNAFACELAVTAVDAADGGTDLTSAFSLTPVGVRLTGAVNRSLRGGGSSGDGSLRRGLKRVAADQAAHVVLSDERTLRLPVAQTLLEVEGEGTDGKPFHEVFRIKVAE